MFSYLIIILLPFINIMTGYVNYGEESPEDLANQFSRSIETEDEDLLASLIHPDLGLEIGGGVEFNGFHLEVDEIRSLGSDKYYACYAPGATDVTIYAGLLEWFLFQGWPEDWKFPKNIIPVDDESEDKIEIIINYDLQDYSTGYCFLTPFSDAGNPEIVSSDIPRSIRNTIKEGKAYDLKGNLFFPRISSDYILIEPQSWLEELGYIEDNPDHLVLLRNEIDYSINYAIFVNINDRWYLRFAGEAIAIPW